MFTAKIKINGIRPSFFYLITNGPEIEGEGEAAEIEILFPQSFAKESLP